jgi:hypothetical protein
MTVFRSSNKAYCVSNTGLGTSSNGTGSNENHSTATPTSTGKGSATATASSAQLNWQLAESYVRSLSLLSVPAGAKFFTFDLLLVCNFFPQSGSTFFSGWNFFTGGDPTNGIVQYVDQQTAVRVVRPFRHPPPAWRV